jgi:tetratricopeptide (TPR) repeat protein
MNDSFTFAADERSNLQRLVVSKINLHFDLMSRDASPAELAISEQALLQALGEFERDPGHRNPAWVTRVVRGNALSTLGRIEEAISLQEESLNYAQTDEEKSKSHNNLCDHYRQTGNPSKAVEHGLKATIICRGQNVGIVLTCAQALYDQDKKQEANSMIASVIKASHLNQPGDILTAHARFDPHFQSMKDLSSVHDLLNDLGITPV